MASSLINSVLLIAGALVVLSCLGTFLFIFSRSTHLHDEFLVNNRHDNANLINEKPRELAKLVNGYLVMLILHHVYAVLCMLNTAMI